MAAHELLRALKATAVAMTLAITGASPSLAEDQKAPSSIFPVRIAEENAAAISRLTDENIDACLAEAGQSENVIKSHGIFCARDVQNIVIHQVMPEGTSAGPPTFTKDILMFVAVADATGRVIAGVDNEATIFSNKSALHSSGFILRKVNGTITTQSHRFIDSPLSENNLGPVLPEDLKNFDTLKRVAETLKREALRP